MRTLVNDLFFFWTDCIPERHNNDSGVLFALEWAELDHFSDTAAMWGGLDTTRPRAELKGKIRGCDLA